MDASDRGQTSLSGLIIWQASIPVKWSTVIGCDAHLVVHYFPVMGRRWTKFYNKTAKLFVIKLQISFFINKVSVNVFFNRREGIL